MDEIPLKFRYDNDTGQLIMRPDFKKIQWQDACLHTWSLESGISQPPLVLQSPGRESMLSEKKRLEEEIDGMLLHVQEVFRNIQRTELALRKQASMLAPIRMLPQEIFRRILAALDPISLPGKKSSLFNLIQVCRSWAATIRDMPEMWTNIAITGFDHSDKWMAKHIDKWKTAPLNIVYQESVFCDVLIDILLKRSSDWWRFQFQPTHDASATQILRVFRALRKATTLRELEMVDRCWNIIKSWENSSRTLISLPRLENLTLRRFERPPCFLSLPNLTYLECEEVRITPEHFYGWVNLMPNVRCICVGNLDLLVAMDDIGNCSQRLLDSPPKFHVLDKLVVNPHTYGLGYRLWPLFLAIIAGSPLLTTVHLPTTVSDHIKSLRNNLMELPEIRSLSLLVITVDYALDSLDFKAYLRLFSGIESLTVEWREDIFEAAAIMVLDTVSIGIGRESNLCPRLQNLSFHDFVGSRISHTVTDALHRLTESMILNRSRYLVSIHSRHKTLINGATPLQLADFLRQY